MTPSTATTAPTRDAAMAVLETLPSVMRAIRGRMREGRPEGVTVAQFRVLVYLRRHPGTDLSAVADHVGTSVPAASELVARLVRQDLVERERDPQSHRRVRLTLSPSGWTALEAAERRTTEWLGSVLGRLDPARLAALLEGLRDLQALAARDDGSSRAP